MLALILLDRNVRFADRNVYVCLWISTRWPVNETKCCSGANVWLLTAPYERAVDTAVLQCTHSHSCFASLFVSTTSIDYKWTDTKVRYCVCIMYLFVFHLSAGFAVKWLAANRAVGLPVEFSLSSAGLDCVWSHLSIPCVTRFIYPEKWWTVAYPRGWGWQRIFLFSRSSKSAMGPTQPPV
jgi:hypothetical protein